MTKGQMQIIDEMMTMKLTPRQAAWLDNLIQYGEMKPDTYVKVLKRDEKSDIVKQIIQCPLYFLFCGGDIFHTVDKYDIIAVGTEDKTGTPMILVA